MFNDLSLLKSVTALARHAAERQSVIAENIANADNPGYRARDLEPFAEAFARGLEASETGAPQFKEVRSTSPGAAKPNGNDVSIEDQLHRSASAARDHETATALYARTLSILRTALRSR